MTYTVKIAAALGAFDRILGVDADERRISLSRFRGRRGRRKLESAYWSGYAEAENYVSNHFKWGAAQAPIILIG